MPRLFPPPQGKFDLAVANQGRQRLTLLSVHKPFAPATSIVPHSFLYLLCATVVLISMSNVRSEDLEALSKSQVWQVRYCVAIKFDSATPIARASLERLSQDPVRRVAQHAFNWYSKTFVVLDPEIVRTAFSRGDFDLTGISVSNRNVFEKPDFWIRDLEKSSEDSLRARAVRAIGMCGVAGHIPKLSAYMGTRNAYLLIELGKAFHRLGDTEKYLAALDAILALPIAEAFFYQTAAVDLLLQTHPERATPAWDRVHHQFTDSPDLEPGWVYSHILQKGRLP